MRRVILAERTPNPDALKFLTDQTLLESGVAEFEDAASAQSRSPLAAGLLALGGVRRVFIAGDFVAVTKDGGADWRMLGPQIQDVLREHLDSAAPAVLGPLPVRVTSDDEADSVARILQEVTPFVASHGGGVEVLAYRDGVLELRLQGACVGCAHAAETLRRGIEGRLRAALPELVEVRTRD